MFTFMKYKYFGIFLKVVIIRALIDRGSLFKVATTTYIIGGASLNK